MSRKYLDEQKDPLWLLLRITDPEVLRSQFRNFAEGAVPADRILWLENGILTEPSQDTSEHQIELIRLQRAELSNRSHVRVG